MNKEEIVRKNIELSSEFGKYMLDNPELAAKILLRGGCYHPPITTVICRG
jgi:hypothetical protein